MTVQHLRRVLAGALAGFLALIVATAGYAQTIETFAGGRVFRDVPGQELPLLPGALAIAPDGGLYIVSFNRGELLHFDPVTGLANLKPDAPDRPSFSYLADVAVSATGIVYAVREDRVVTLDVADGHQESLSGGGSRPERCTGQPYSPAWYRQVTQISAGADGNVYVADSGAHSICRVSPSGSSSLVAGTGSDAFSPDGTPAEFASLSYPRGVAADADGNVYIADTGNNRERKLSAADRTLSTVAGTGECCFNGDQIPAVEANLDSPERLVLDAAGNLYIYEAGGQRVRRVDAGTGRISTVAGGGYEAPADGIPATHASFSEMQGLAIAANGDVYFSDYPDRRVRRVDAATGLLSTAVGNGTAAFCGEGAPRRETCLSTPQGVALDAQGNVFVSDSGNYRLRRVDGVTDTVTTLAGGGTPGILAEPIPATDVALPSEPEGLALDAQGNVYFATGWDNRIRRVDPSGMLTTIAGDGTQGYAGDGGPATSARLFRPLRIVVDGPGNVYFSDSYNHRVRRIDRATGVITTVAGNGLSTGALGDGGPASAASVGFPRALALDPLGNLLVFDSAHLRVRKVDRNTGVITTVAGNGSWQIHGDGLPATSAGIGADPQIAVDPAGNIFLASAAWLRRISAATGVITSVTPPAGLNTPEGLSMQYPTALAFDGYGRLLIADTEQDRVFRVSGLPIGPADNTPPVVEARVTGRRGQNDWYVGDVQVAWTVTDPESAIAEQIGCENASITQDNGGTVYRCEARSAGGWTSRNVFVRRDATPPVITLGTPFPAAPNANGWYPINVSVPFTATDALSGIVEVTGENPLVVEGDGAGIYQTAYARDQAGNETEVDTPHFNIDTTPPVVQLHLDGLQGNDGWYRGDVHVSWSIEEIPESITSMTGCEAASVTTDTALTTFECRVYSTSGGFEQIVEVKRDATPPTLTFGTATPLPNSLGWNKTNVSVPFTRADALSGIASVSSASPLVVSEEGGGVTGRVVVTDRAGNAATFDTAPLNIDKSPPFIQILVPAQGATYGFYQDLPADYYCDDISILTCVVPTGQENYVNTRTAGTRSYKITSKDSVGFSRSLTHTFTVESTFNFGGFLVAQAPPTLNRVARGALVPIRWQLPDGRGGFVSNPASFVSATVGSLTCGSAPMVPLNDTATGPAGLSYDAATGTFTYNWQTGASWSGCRKLTIRLRDGSQHELRFRIQ